MARERNKLTAIGLRNVGDGKHNDGAGLMLHKKDSGGRWIYRYSFAGVRRDMGLGSYPEVSLAEARKSRDLWASLIASGRDPISTRERQLEAERAELDRRDPTFAEVAEVVFEAKKVGLRGDGERGRWFSPIRLHLIPKLGKRRITEIHQSDIRDVLAPIWKSKPPTAEKAIQRLHIIFTHAKLSGINVDPFTVKAAHHMLGDVRHTVTPIPATAWQDIPDLYQRLDRRGASFQCLRWMILTAVRSEGARGARFSEIDRDVWTIPAERMKGNEGKTQPFRVPLSDAALAIIEYQRQTASDDLIFSYQRGKGITSTSIEKGMNILGEAGRPHGFRTSFRTWVQDTEAASYDVAETALNHTIGSKVERSYARSDLLEQRRMLMRYWADFVTQVSSASK